MTQLSRWATRTCLATTLLLALAGTAQATTISGYDKSVAYPLSEVTIRGSNFPPRSGVSVVYGRRDTTLGVIRTVGEWNGTSIRVTLPTNMPEGRYWLGLDGLRGGLVKGGENLMVRPIAVQHAPATKSTAASPPAVAHAKPPGVQHSSSAAVEHAKPPGVRQAPAVQHAKPPSVRYQPSAPAQPSGQRAGLPTGTVVLQETPENDATLDIDWVSDPGLVTPGSLHQIQVRIRNYESVGARFLLGYKTLENSHYVPGDPQYIGPKATVRLQVPMYVDPKKVRNGEFRTELWLADPDRKPRRQRYQQDTSHEIVWRSKQPSYRVTARLQDLRVLHHCDGSDDYGEWRVRLSLGIDGQSARSSSVWPGSDDYADVSVGKSLETGLWAELKGVPADKNIKISVRVEDDDDVSSDIAQGFATVSPSRWVEGTTQGVENRPENAMGCDNEREIFAGNVTIEATVDDGNRVTIPVSQGH